MMALKHPSIRIDILKTMHRAWIILALLVVCYIAGQILKFKTGHGYIYGFVPKFDMNAKISIPGYYTSILLFVAAGLLLMIARLKKAPKDAFYRHWLVLGAVFLLLSADELVGFHDISVTPLRALLANTGIFYFGWVIPAFVLVAVFGLFYVRFLQALALKHRIRFAVAGIIYVGGALGMELTGGMYLHRHGCLNLTYRMIVLGEETLEIAGAILFVQALLNYIQHYYPKLNLRFNAAKLNRS